MKVLVIAPHPDDEILGCGGTIIKHSQAGDEVFRCLVTKAYTPDWSEEFLRARQVEIKASGEIVGIKKTYFLDFSTAKLDTVPQKELNEALSKAVKEVEPDVLYIPHQGDIHKDHRLVFESSLVAARLTGSRIKKILSYETPSETEWGQAIEPFIPDIYVNVSKTFDKKIEAMKAYKSEIREYPHPRSLEVLRVIAQKRGSEAGIELAEGFALIREIIN